MKPIVVITILCIVLVPISRLAAQTKSSQNSDQGDLATLMHEVQSPSEDNKLAVHALDIAVQTQLIEVLKAGLKSPQQSTRGLCIERLDKFPVVQQKAVLKDFINDDSLWQLDRSGAAGGQQEIVRLMLIDKLKSLGISVKRRDLLDESARHQLAKRLVTE